VYNVGITRLLFGGRKHPNMLTTAQIKAREAGLRDKGVPDITAGFTEEMARLKPLDIEPPTKGINAKTIESAMVQYAIADKEPPAKIKEMWEKEAVGTTKPKTTTLTATAPDGSQTQQIASYTVDPDTKALTIHDVAGVGEKRPEAPAPISTKEQRTAALRFLDGVAPKNPILEDLLSSAKSGDDDSLRTFNKLWVDVAERALTLREKAEHRGKEFKDVLELAFKEMKPGLTMVEGAPSWVPEMAKGLFEEPAFEKPTGELPLINTQEEYDKLPSGSTYKEADGKTYRKP